MTTHAHNIDRCEITWASLDFKEGLPAGSMVQEQIAHESSGMRETGMGGVVVWFIPGRSGTLTVQVEQTSKLHQQLLDKLEQHRLTRDQFFPFKVNDATAKEQFTYTNAFIMKEPDEGRGTDPGVYAWVFGFESKQRVTNTNEDNVVGQ